MNETNKQCPQCGGGLPAGALEGLCPKCLLEAVSCPTEPDPKAETAPDPSGLAAAFPGLELLELIGQGGMGWVYKARQPKLDRVVALKVLSPALAANPAFAERFAREARVLARLSHPNIVNVYDFGQADGHFYFVMEYVDGVNLRQAMRAGGFSPPQALALIPSICEALQYAHGEGILHRDIKPENILLDSKGRVKIADFGIAKLAGEAGVGSTLTGTGAALGTPHYMAPEQLERPAEVDHRADIYSLGVVFYEMLTGELPLGRFSPPSAKATVDPRIDQVVLRALEKERERRFQSAGQVKTEVETISATPPPQPAAPGVSSPARETRGWAFRLALASGILSLPCYLADGVLAINYAPWGGAPLSLLMIPAGLCGLLAFALGAAALAKLAQRRQKRGNVLATVGIGAAPLMMLLSMRPFILQLTGLASRAWAGGPVGSWIIPVSSAVLALAVAVFALWCRRRTLDLSPRHGSSRPRLGVGWVLLGVGLMLLISLPPLTVLTHWISHRRTHAPAPNVPMALLRPYPNDAGADASRGRRFNAQVLAPGGHVLLVRAQTWSNGVPLADSELTGYLTVPVEQNRTDILLVWNVLEGPDRARAPWNLVIGAGPDPILYPAEVGGTETRWQALAIAKALVIPQGGTVSLPILIGTPPQGERLEVRLTLELIAPDPTLLGRFPDQTTAGKGTNWTEALATVHLLE